MPKPRSPEPRSIVITGVSRGLGRALVDAFAAGGHRVAGCARDATSILELSRRYGTPHAFAVADVSDDDAVRSWASDLLETWGVPDLLINNAAVIHRNARVWTLSDEEFGNVIDVNVRGVANVIRHFVPSMVARRRGVIVNVSSGWGRSTSPEVAGYCASKWAIEGLTQALAQELPAGMAAVPFNPGIIDTDMLRSSFGSGAQSYPQPASWVKAAAPFLLGLGPEDNGRSFEIRI
jgi:NAD(P)-dependent dehydrogenase (short-subunit alcohol dehydrogenase family)